MCSEALVKSVDVMSVGSVIAEALASIKPRPTGRLNEPSSDHAPSEDAWFMLWDGYGDLGPAIEALPRGTIHRVPEPPDVPAELVGGTWAYRHYLVFRGPLAAMGTWFD